MELSLIFNNFFESWIPFAITSVAIVLVTLYYVFKDKDLPPGPIGLPVFGYWPFLKPETCHIQLNDLKKKYGDVFSFTSVGRLFINLGNAKVLREAHITKSNCFEGRYTAFNMFTCVFSEGLFFANGEEWKVLRKFFLNVLKERGMLTNKGSMCDSMYDSIKSLIVDLTSKKGEPVKMNELMTSKCSTILQRMCFGSTGISDQQLQQICDNFCIMVSSMTITNTLLIGNLARYILLPLYPGYHAIRKSNEKIESILHTIIKDHKNTYDEEYIRDIIDDFFKERDNRRNKGDKTAEYFTDNALASTVFQIVADGITSVSIFICIFLKLILDHPEDQEKIYQEIMEVVGPHRQPTIEDRSKLAYTNAFIFECLRTSEFFPVFPSLECTKETTVHGYRIPKGAITLLNTWCAHFDPETYEEPEKFNPSRFLVSEGKQRPDLPVNFGVGKRSCIGEGYVMMQVFLFLTTIVQNFQVTQPKQKNFGTLEEVMTGELNVCFYPRINKEH